MLSLDTIEKRVNTMDVVFRGQEVTLRGLTPADHLLLEKIYPSPVPPRGPDPEKGDGAPEVPLLNDLGYKRAVAEHVAGVMAGQAAVALDWKTADGKTWADVRGEVGHAKRFLANCAEEFVDADLSREEIEFVLQHTYTIGRRGTRSRAKDDPGN